MSRKKNSIKENPQESEAEIARMAVQQAVTDLREGVAQYVADLDELLTELAQHPPNLSRVRRLAEYVMESLQDDTRRLTAIETHASSILAQLKDVLRKVASLDAENRSLIREIEALVREQTVSRARKALDEIGLTEEQFKRATESMSAERVSLAVKDWPDLDLSQYVMHSPVSPDTKDAVIGMIFPNIPLEAKMKVQWFFLDASESYASVIVVITDPEPIGNSPKRQAFCLHAKNGQRPPVLTSCRGGIVVDRGSKTDFLLCGITLAEQLLLEDLVAVKEGWVIGKIQHQVLRQSISTRLNDWLRGKVFGRGRSVSLTSDDIFSTYGGRIRFDGQVIRVEWTLDDERHIVQAPVGRDGRLQTPFL